ncbi:hypothetical protein Q2T46_15665 [Thermoanaerobacterium sp. CMT5567-10]|uniref:hypothetical protein n=1 Tax=Thermoanaerobacterium sp. CMT5567-10 TaxID=3061989 RepID=UPI00287FB9E3|nr:hypothetical protein [Thermoanaerobacterium sp. CMT5567-10]WLY85458.1 hypothetical protein Q2T46_15665 [Thermoanaerobacterium sp. CMT5567-10]
MVLYSSAILSASNSKTIVISSAMTYSIVDTSKYPIIFSSTMIGAQYNTIFSKCHRNDAEVLNKLIFLIASPLK